MSYTSQDNASDKSGFCHLGSDLVISYNGSLLECIPVNRCSLVGTILTRNGQLISRNNRRDNWQNLLTPSVYLFYDNDTNVTFLVDTCKCKIKEIEPCGRILDCTDRIIYEIKCGDWVPICDLSNRQQRTIVLCNSVGATATTALFEFPGSNPVVDCFSEVLASNVTFLGNSATVTFPLTGPGSLAAGGCTTLIFTVCIDHETVTIVKIFIRQTGAALQRFSAQAGTFGTRAAVGVLIPTLPTIVTPGPAPTALPAFPPITEAAVAPINLWAIERYDRPADSFNPATGIFTAPVAGDYEIDAVLTYNATLLRTLVNGADNLTPFGPHAFLPRFVLVRNRTATAPGEIIADAPIDAQVEPITTSVTAIVTAVPPSLAITTTETVAVPCGTPVSTAAAPLATQFNLAEQGQAVISTGITLAAGDTLQILYIDDVNCYGGTIPPNLGYTLDPLGTSFRAELLA